MNLRNLLIREWHTHCVAILAFFFLLFFGLKFFNQKIEIEISAVSDITSHMQVFYDKSGKFTEEDSQRFAVPGNNESVNLKFSLPRQSNIGELRLDPLEAEGNIVIKSINVKTSSRDLQITATNLSDYLIGHSGLKFVEDGSGLIKISSLGIDPILVLKLPQTFAKLSSADRVALAILITIITYLGVLMHSRIWQFLEKIFHQINSSILCREHPKILAFLIVSFICLIYSMSYLEPEPFCCDAKGYWDFSEYFKSKEGITFDLYNSSLRGYLLPFLLFLIRSFADLVNVSQFKFFFFVNSIFTSVSLAVLVPFIVEKMFSCKVKFWGILGFSLLYLIFWRGFLLYPMTDTWSTFFVFLAIAFLLCDNRGLPIVARVILSGVFLGAALNFRPIYLISLIFFLPLVLILPHGNKIQRMLLVPALVFGIIIPLIPQIKINSVQFHTFSPLVQTNVAYGGGDLYLVQLFFGASVQRHECAVFMDEQGDAVLKASGINNYSRNNSEALYKFIMAEKTYKDYFVLVTQHPADFIAIYTRHIFNGVGVFGSSIYNCSLSRTSMLLSYAAWFFAALFVGFFIRFAFYFKWQSLLIFVVITMPAFMTIPTAMEARYFLPLHIIVYVVLTMSSLSKEMLSFFSAQLKIIIAAFLIFMFVCIVHIGQLFSSMHTPVSAMTKDWKLTYTPHGFNN